MYNGRKFEEKLKEIYGRKYSLIGDFIDLKTNVTIKCNDCGNCFDIIPEKILHPTTTVCKCCREKEKSLKREKENVEIVLDLVDKCSKYKSEKELKSNKELVNKLYYNTCAKQVMFLTGLSCSNYIDKDTLFSWCEFAIRHSSSIEELQTRFKGAYHYLLNAPNKELVSFLSFLTINFPYLSFLFTENMVHFLLPYCITFGEFVNKYPLLYNEYKSYNFIKEYYNNDDNYTYDLCLSYMKRYPTIKDFNDAVSFKNLLKRKGWIESIIKDTYGSDLDINRKDNSIIIKERDGYTMEEIFEITKDYKNKTDLSKHDKLLYDYLKKYNLFDIVFPGEQIKEYTFEECKEFADLTKNRSDFKKVFKDQYLCSLKNKWIDTLIPEKEIRRKNCYFIYAYEFRDINGLNYVYVGLTNNLHKRDEQHHGKIMKISKNREIIPKSSVYNFAKNYNIDEYFPIVLERDLGPDEASQKEKEYLEKYISSGWQPINKAPAGSLGGSPDRFTKEECAIIAMQYDTITEFQLFDQNHYSYAYRNGFLNEICSHMNKGKFKKITYDECLLCVKKYNSIEELKENNRILYGIIEKNHWYRQIKRDLKNNEIDSKRLKN